VGHFLKAAGVAGEFFPVQVGVKLQAAGLAVERVLFLAEQLRAEVLTTLAALLGAFILAAAVEAGVPLVEAAVPAAKLLT
jgi:hypothetical protein